MQPDRAIGRYRRWYARLLRLYPRPFRQRFGEPMAQTFTDLIRERRAAQRGVHAFALGTFAETSAGILRENLTQIMDTKNVIRWGRWVLLTAAILAIPAVAMALQLAGVAWGPMDFAILGVLVLGAGLLYEYASMKAGSSAQRIAVGIAVVAGLGLIWVNLAVGMIGDEGNPANLMYLFVIFTALIGASVSRFQPREASTWMFATAGVQAAVAIIALVAGLPATPPADAFFVAAWVASGLLFRQASLASAPAS
ncbi:MAG TPA: hypothetical protein VFW95_08285 [Candidatus Limnocylindria bacterium]|nr:hypothetical protein [Candidatus Limnocylindria bacterium]